MIIKRFIVSVWKLSGPQGEVNYFWKWYSFPSFVNIEPEKLLSTYIYIDIMLTERDEVKVLARKFSFQWVNDIGKYFPVMFLIKFGYNVLHCTVKEILPICFWDPLRSFFRVKCTLHETKLGELYVLMSFVSCFLHFKL